ncbi:galactan 1,3-beta-galactosidase [Roridomyces roridus]|uniref:Galactan 1,3-beta-galactosidase n=1 Tax=Roridomyces roridus TaxID=1738132 RepID=A0AAD7BTU6_9AGAR|nr:galactan 1,3-beta-galactosidase [Roridomyces roridus]
MRFSALLVFAPLFAQAVLIVPGATWKDTSGNTIQAHGAGFLKVNSTYYWFGEDKAANSALFSAVSCYTSPDLGTWTRQNNALTPIANTMISSSNIVERPKGSFNSEYVMWFHSDTSNYGAAQVGVATSKTPCGPYTYKGSFSPLGAESRDESVFQDDDAAQTAYLLYASDNNQNFKISRMDANYYNLTAQVNVLTASTLEAPGMLKRNGQYFLFASHTSGWAPNPNKYFVASTLDLNPVATYYSQNAFDLAVGTNALYAGDRWRSDILGSSTYIWLPLSWASGVPQLVWADLWNLNIANGSYSVVTGGTTYEAEKGVRSGSSTLISDSSFRNGGSVAITVQGSGAQQWVSLYIANGDSTWRNSTVSVNGGASVVVQQPNTGGGQIVLSVPLSLNLKSGSNTITFGAGQSNYAADLDKIIVYPPQPTAGTVPPGTTTTSSSTGGSTDWCVQVCTLAMFYSY